MEKREDKDDNEAQKQRDVTEGSEESFPASDPPATSNPGGD